MIQDKFKYTEQIFSISNQTEFEKATLAVFKFQYLNNEIYKQYCDFLKLRVDDVVKIQDIPFLPISFFKTHKVYVGSELHDKEFTSSGTTGMVTSSHFVKNIETYETSFIKGFEQFYGSVDDYIILGLLPSYLEREGSSLIYMVEKLIALTNNDKSGFFLDDFEGLLKVITENNSDKKVILIGVSYALLDLAEQFNPDLSACI